MQRQHRLAGGRPSVSERLENRLLFAIPEPNNTFASAYTPTDNIYLERNVLASDSVSASDPDDYLKFFSLYGKSKLYVALNGLTSDADLYVYDGNQNLLSSSRLSGNASETVTVDVPASQYFYIRVAKYNGGSTNYNLYLYNDYAGNSLSTARDLGTSLGQTNSKYAAYGQLFLNDYMDYRDNVDVYKFTMETAGTISLRRLGTQNSEGLLVANLQLLDSSGGVLVNRGATSAPIDVDRFSVPAGTYYVRTTQTSGSGSYQLRVVSDYAGDTTATARNLGDVTNSSRAETDMVGNAGGVSYDDALDLYKIVLNKAAPLDLVMTVDQGLTPPTFDANLFLARDNNGNGFIESGEISNSSSAAGRDELHFSSLAAGTYYVGVRQNGAYTTYTLNLDSDFDSVSGTGNYRNMTKAQNIGTLTGYSDFDGGFGISPNDLTDFTKFTLNAAATVKLSAFPNSVLSEPGTHTVSVGFVRDANNNGVMDTGELLNQATGSTSANLAAGTYFAYFGGSGGQIAYYGSITADYAGNSISKARALATISGSAPATQTFKDYIEQSFGTGSDVEDYYSFNLTAGTTVTLKTTGVSGEDSLLQLIKDANNNGTIDSGDILQTSDVADSTNETITRTLAAGKYFVRVKGVNGSTNYTLTASFGNTPVVDPDDTFAKVANRTANIKSVGQSGDYSLTESTDVDLIKFTVTAGQRVGFDVDARNGSNIDTFLRIFNSSGTQLATNNDGFAPGESTSKFSYLAHTFATAGTYYVGVSINPNTGYNPTTGNGDVAGNGSLGDYRLTLSNVSTAKTGTISGLLFADTNKNGVYNSGTDSLAGNRQVWLDLDDDGKLDANEPSKFSDANGAFSFTGLAQGTYHVRRVFPSGFIESTPARVITIPNTGGVFSNVNIGSKAK